MDQNILIESLIQINLIIFDSINYSHSIVATSQSFRIGDYLEIRTDVINNTIYTFHFINNIV